MQTTSVILPSKPRIVSEEKNKGVYEIDGFYPGYGHTIGNSLRRIILSSMPGVAITTVKIDGVPHEFATLEGMKEDVLTVLLNLQKVRFSMVNDEPQVCTISVSGIKEVTSDDIKAPGQVEVLDKKLHLAHLTDKSSKLEVEFTVEKGMGYVPKEDIHKDKLEVGTIALDASFTPVKRANYEVENMRVGDRTNYNRVRLFIETDGVISAREALEKSIDLMIGQLSAIRGFKVEEKVEAAEEVEMLAQDSAIAKEDVDTAKVKIEDLDLSPRTMNALIDAGIRSVGGLSRKKESDLESVDGLGEKGIKEIKRALSNFGITLK